MLKLSLHTHPLVLRFNFLWLETTSISQQRRYVSFTKVVSSNEKKPEEEHVRNKSLSQEKRVLHRWTEEEQKILLTAAKKYRRCWRIIASTHFPDRSPNACYQMYLSLEGNFKRGPWTPEEDESLRQLTSTEPYNGRWKVISDSLNRSSSSCYSRWQTRLKPDVKTGLWTKEEDRALLRGVEKYGRDWSRIVREIPGRSSKHALLRYDKFLSPKTKRDKWTAEEDELLIEGYRQYGRSWTKIAESIPGRTALQLQARYDSCIGRKINKGRWTREENERLLELVKKYGTNWTQISQELKTRTNAQALVRYKYICQKENVKPEPVK